MGSNEIDNLEYRSGYVFIANFGVVNQTFEDAGTTIASLQKHIVFNNQPHVEADLEDFLNHEFKKIVDNNGRETTKNEGLENSDGAPSSILSTLSTLITAASVSTLASAKDMGPSLVESV